MGAQEWLLLNSGLGRADLNMALDEALLEAMPRLGRPVIRFYGWSEPAASFGYFQKYAEVEKLTPLRPLVRRPTGGGIVPHDLDWTYSMTVPPTHEWYSIKAIESYRRMHAWVRLAFSMLKVEAALAQAALKTGPGQCFSGFERFDLIHEEQKIAGAAQRRRRDGLLVQGSVHPPAVVASLRPDWQQAMCAAGALQHGITWRTWTPDEVVTARAAELARAKYSLAEYNQGR
jgi:lipoate-protein ligase A